MHKTLLLFLISMLLLAPSQAQTQPTSLSLAALPSPIILKGDATTAYRDPAALYHNGTFYLYFTLVRKEPVGQIDGKIYMYLAESRSRDLRSWTPPRMLTPRDPRLNYSSPGNVVRDGEGWVICFQT